MPAWDIRNWNNMLVFLSNKFINIRIVKKVYDIEFPGCVNG